MNTPPSPPTRYFSIPKLLLSACSILIILSLCVYHTLTRRLTDIPPVPTAAAEQNPEIWFPNRRAESLPPAALTNPTDNGSIYAVPNNSASAAPASPPAPPPTGGNQPHSQPSPNTTPTNITDSLF